MITDEEFKKFVRTYTPHLLRFATRIGGSVLEPHDILQECFETLWRNKDSVHPGSVKSFLFTVAHRRIIDSYRRLKITVNEMEVEEDISEEPFTRTSETHEIIHMGLKCLSPLHRELVVLRDLEGYNYQEIGKICELTESQVKVYLFRARKSLKTAVESFEKEII